MTVRDKSIKEANAWSSTIQVEAENTYRVRMFVHNNAADNLDLIAENTRVTVGIDTPEAKTENSITVYIDANNASPATVWDDEALRLKNPFISHIYPDPLIILITGQTGSIFRNLNSKDMHLYLTQYSVVSA